MRRKKRVSLLDVGDEAIFDEPGRRFPRWLEPVNLGPAAARRRGEPPPPARGLVPEVLSTVGAATRSSGRWSRAACIEIRENDGMSWSAESVRSALAGKYPGFEVIAIRNEAATDRLPRVSEIVGRSRLRGGAGITSQNKARV